MNTDIAVLISQVSISAGVGAILTDLLFGVPMVPLATLVLCVACLVATTAARVA